MTRPIVLATAAAALFAVTVAEAAQVGTAVVGGRTVILEDNNTWRYAEEVSPGAAAPCDRFPQIEICIKDIGWTRAPSRGGFDALYSNAGKYYLALIREPYGEKSGVSPEALQNAIIYNAAAASKLTPEQVPVIASASEVASVPGARSVTYSAKLSGVPLVYYNVFKVRENESVQIVFWGVGADVSPEFSAKIAETLAKIKVD